MSKVDFSKPIEAVHEDGRVVAAGPFNDDGHAWPDEGGQYHVDSGNMLLFANADGSNHFPELYGGGWRIRNVATPPTDARTAPNGGEVGPEVVERMIACLRAAAAVAKDSVFGQSGYASEARAIVALLPEPVDADEAEAAKIAQGMIYCNDDSVSHDRIVRLCKDAIKRGRALASENK